MSFVPGGATAGTAAAAAAAAEKARKEEEEMTTYKREDLTEGWEFKMLRSMRSTFKKPERLQAVLADESRAGWTLVEKFDDSRIRLKRPASAKEADGQLDFDAYRTWVGISQARYILIIILLSLGIPLVVALVIFAMAR
jgi:hypothetical protein